MCGVFKFFKRLLRRIVHHNCRPVQSNDNLIFYETHWYKIRSEPLDILNGYQLLPGIIVQALSLYPNMNNLVSRFVIIHAQTASEINHVNRSLDPENRMLVVPHLELVIFGVEIC
ncbi:hypothetical protein MIMGU_mgv1a016624mg [Erythranthe guttata]|uniref:Uncharacterized protein n=1 Tax=Erythranthe guttata TaxID=4155 RepID=A0A022RK72_ERYGU|nr:hypothetical protein MIMGU_mgv1a016624mg [Erythranthe guttata]